jgi:hypothetical protein
MTNLRIRSIPFPGEPGIPENAGEWYAASITEYHRRVLREYQSEEPNRGWHFETRGTGTLWRKVRE